MTLYSYCLRYDDGAAPNPYWNVCSLVICKPAIRRVAQENDWIVGLGSVHSPIGDISSSVVYGMKVTKGLSMRDYDRFCREELTQKIPDLRHPDFRRRVGDCIYYDFSDPNGPKLRQSVHDDGNRDTDLRGQKALLSTHYYYFGDRPIPLPKELYPIVHRMQGHKSRANADFLQPFVDWIEGSGFKANQLYGEPQLKGRMMEMSDCRGVCSTRDREDDENDKVC